MADTRQVGMKFVYVPFRLLFNIQLFICASDISAWRIFFVFEESLVMTLLMRLCFSSNCPVAFLIELVSQMVMRASIVLVFLAFLFVLLRKFLFSW